MDTKEALLEKIATAIELGKINRSTPYPPELSGQDGADELTKEALEMGIPPSDVLNKALIPGMERIGRKFAEHKVFVPQMLISARAMTAAMVHIKPYYNSGAVRQKGTFVIGTVLGDLHDIGKNLVAMMIEGAGWEVIDLGIDVKPSRFIETIQMHPDCIVGLSAMLTTTMENMEKTVQEIKHLYPEKKILVGGAPLTDDFCRKIGATFYSPDPQGAVSYLKELVA